jgi:hypothetical protein
MSAKEKDTFDFNGCSMIAILSSVKESEMFKNQIFNRISKKKKYILFTAVSVGLVILSVFFRKTSHSVLTHIEEASQVDSSSEKIAAQSTPRVAPIAAKLVQPPDEGKMLAEKRARLQSMIQETLQNMPTIRDLRALKDEEVHFTPDIVARAAERIGDIAQAIHDEPALKNEAIPFYGKCTENAETPTSIRALCYFKLTQLDPHHEHFDERSIPDNIKNLTKNFLRTH